MPDRDRSDVWRELERRAEAVRERLAEDRAHLEDMRHRVQLEEQLLQAMELLIQTERGVPAQARGSLSAQVAERARRPTIAEAVTSVLLEHGGPLHADEIMEQLQSRGIEMSDKDPKATVVTALVRGTKKGLFVRTGPNTFRLARPAERGEA